MRGWAIVSMLLVGASAQSQSVTGKEEILFNGKNFKGWTFYLEEKGYNAGGKGKISDFASVKPGGVIQIDPKYHGALMTKKDYNHYKLHAEFRWVNPTGQHNSGLFLRIRPPFVWDSEHGETQRTYMIQVQPGSTGDIWALGYNTAALNTPPERANIPYGTGTGHIAQHRKIKEAEKPVGEWNMVDVTLLGKNVSIWLNGELVQEASALVDLPGRIGLESEFGPIQFRNIRVTELAAPPPPPPPPPGGRGGGGGGRGGGGRGGAPAGGTATTAQ